MSVLHSLGFAGAAGIVVRLVLDQLAEIHRRHTKRARRRGHAPRDGIPKLKPGTRVVLYGLSANPPTGDGGHGSIVQHLAELFDEVWILPVYRHVYSAKQNLAPYEHRERMCDLAFTDGADRASPLGSPEKKGRSGTSRKKKSRASRARGVVRVLDVERRVVTSAQARARRRGLPLESVTVGSHDVLMAVKARRGNERAHFAWCLGGDAYRDLRLGKWRESDAFQRACAQVVVPREGGLEGLEQVGIGPNARVLQIEEVSESISSTVIRTMLAERAAFRAAPGNANRAWDGGDFDAELLRDALAPGVRAYIEKHGLYGTAPGMAQT
jgi:nicotinic acid mononucleotide adenylyltransferase